MTDFHASLDAALHRHQPADLRRWAETVLATNPHADTRQIARQILRLLDIVDTLTDHEPRVRTTGYGGHVTYCACGHDGDYLDHIRTLTDV